MAYLLFACPREEPLVESVIPFVEHFHQRCALTSDEASVLFDLAVMRVCTSVCMSAYQSKLEPDNQYLLISAAPAWRTLERLAVDADSCEKASVLIRRACSFE
jgi:Ser/Thr protein kinase RdoA (MazF antagonist)